MSISPELFEEQLRYLRSRYEVVPLEALVGSRGDGRVAITFDDGYRDLLDHAVPLFEELELPATFFVIAGYVARGEPFWWETLADRTALAGPAGKLIFKARFRRLRRLHALAAAERLASNAIPATPRSLSEADVKLLSSNPLFEIGCHSMWHSRLSRITPAQLEEEIGASRQVLETVTAQAVRYFAYPYGDTKSYDRESCRLAGQEYDFAFTNHSSSEITNPVLFPRISVGRWQSNQLHEAILQKGF